jgi:hypothetical protein
MKTTISLLASLLLTGALARAGDVIPDGPEEKPQLGKIAGEMTWARDRLEAEHTGGSVQVKQDQITAALDKLIKAWERQQNSPPADPDGPPSPNRPPRPSDSSSPSNESDGPAADNPASPLNDEKLTRGFTRHGFKAALGAIGAKWGTLPRKTRPKIVQALTSKMPLRYRGLMIIYYAALAEEASR